MGPVLPRPLRGPLLPRTIGEDGEFPEPCPYVWEYSYMSAALFFEALRRVTGEDLLAHPAFPGWATC